MKRWLASLVIREMLVETTVGYQYTFTRAAKMKEAVNAKGSLGYGQAGKELSLLVGRTVNITVLEIVCGITY